MRTYALAFLLFIAGAAHGAQTCRWVDERGVTNYGEIEDTRAVAKSLYYYPTSSDPFLTAVTIRGGWIANLERNRKTN
jgi:hypothetical protein